MPSSSNKRSTGTVPKAKPPRKNSVPQEMVAPTRRDLQDHLNEFFASVAERASKPENQVRATVGGDTCFELDYSGLQENSRYCLPVGPIPRRINEDMNDSHSLNLSLGNGSSAAVGVVMPITPFHQEFNDHTSHTSRSNQPADLLNDSSSSSLTIRGTQAHLSSTIGGNMNGNVEDKISQIQEYIRITSNLINSIQSEKSNLDNGHEVASLVSNLESLKASEQKLLRIANPFNSTKNIGNIDTMAAATNGTILISTALENVASPPIEVNGPRPQSVSSICLSNPNTPTYEELQNKLETSNRNMNNLKEQHQQLLKIHQSAKQQLNDMENIRDQQQTMSFANNENGMPDYDNPEDIQNDVESMLNRMKILTDFIQNQNELASFFGEKGEMVEEQMQLQQKLTELKNRKQQMSNLVNELQTMNGETKQNYSSSQNRDQTPVRNVPVEYERIVPIELVQHNRNSSHIPVSNSRYSTPLQNNKTNPLNDVKQMAVQAINADVNGVDDDDDDDDDELATDAGENSILSDKIAEINAMKSQLKRLKDMMHTVKLIEMKNGDSDGYDNSARSSRSQSHFETQPENYSNNAVKLQSQVKPVNNVQAEEPQRDDEEANMDERVRALQSMTQDLKKQAVSLAVERDRLKDIKNEMYRRREGEVLNSKNIKQKRGTNLGGGHSRDTEQDLLKSDYELKKKEFENLVVKLDTMDEMANNAQETGKKDQAEHSFYSGNWRPGQNVSSASSLRSTHERERQSVAPSLKPNLPPSNVQPGKDSTDSGAADVLGMSADAGSLQSGSSRGFSVPPPMRTISSRDAPVWRKTSQETSRISSINQPNSTYENTHETYPWYFHNNYSCNGGPLSPHCHCNHHIGSEQHYCRPVYHQNVTQPPSVVNTSDPMLIQQFIQTQQMLINSVCQCNQLLWDQQREINNLNSAVILLQERILNNANSETSQTIRSESVPPNVTCTNTQSFLPRAQSEQPLNNHPSSCCGPQPNSSMRQYSFPCQNQSVYRGSQSNSNMNNRSMRYANIQPHSSAVHQHHQQQQQQRTAELPVNYYQNEIITNANASATNLGNQIFPNNFISPSMHIQPTQSTPQSNVMLNNDLNSPLLNSSQCQSSSPPIFIHHNNNSTNTTVTATTNANANANNNANINNQLHQQNLAVAASTTTANSSAFNSSVPPALNNQVPPGNRANNYWDNFRSYSRQNLLSTNSCKSNEDACSSGNSPHNRDQNYQTSRNTLPTQMTHNNLPSMGGGNKYLPHFRNQINQQQNTVAAPPDVLNINQHQPSSHSENLSEGGGGGASGGGGGGGSGGASNFNNLNISAVAPMPQLNQSVGNFNINAINLELNELKPNSTKMLPKGSTGGSKRIRQIREREQNNLSSSMQQGVSGCGSIDLNLASTVNRPDSKSSAKLFESLKENVYLEVSALIAANESRPHFLINLFRELQLLSASDPLRNRLMQAFQELYNRYCEPTIQEESSSQSVQNDATPENPQHDSTQSSDNRYNQSMNSVDFPSAESTPVRIFDLQASIDEDILRSIMLEIVDFLHNVEQINETALQRITQIAFRHINSPSNKTTGNLNKYFINQDDFMQNLHNLDLRNREIFLESLENYLSNILMGNTPNTSQEVEDELFQRQAMDLTAPVQCKSNEVLSAMRKKEETITLADVVAVINQMPITDNQDLAEADQVCNSDEVYSAEEDLNDHNERGAVGGSDISVTVSTEQMGASGGGNSIGGNSINMSTLPDLAKVTTLNNSVEDESVWMVNEEVVQHITNQSNMTDTMGNINLNGDPKQKNL